MASYFVIREPVELETCEGGEVEEQEREARDKEGSFNESGRVSSLEGGSNSIASNPTSNCFCQRLSKEAATGKSQAARNQSRGARNPPSSTTMQAGKRFV